MLRVRWMRTLGLVAFLAWLPARAGFAQEDGKKKDPEGVGKRLAQHVERQARFVKAPFNIKVIDSEEVNAFALPGGFFFVNSGLILKAESEAELAGLLAHEIAHVAARHGPRQATRPEPAQYLSIPLTFLQFSRSFEAEADLLGLEYMYKAGYDPTALADFFGRLRTLEKKPGAVAKVFSSHPMTGDRVKASQKNSQEYLKAKPQYVVNTSEFEEVKTHLVVLNTWRKPGDQDLYPPCLRKRPGREDLTNLAEPDSVPAR